MGRSYRKGNASELELAKKAAEQWHPELVEHDVRVGMVFTSASKNDHGEPTCKAVTFAGTGVVAKVRRVTPKERLWCDADVMIEVDADRWASMSEEERTAVVDHELTHVELARAKDGSVKLTEDLRPAIKFRPDDWMLTGFREVIERHGKSAIEAQSLHEVGERVGQLVFEFAGA